MAKFVPVSGPVVANTVYSNNKLVARDTALTLPEVVPMTADLKVMGTYTKPIWQLIEHMEAAITKIGQDMGLHSLLVPGEQHLEVRWMQTITEVGGKTREVGCKAFLRGEIGKLPEIGQEVGSTTESECTLALSKYQLFVDGAEMWHIDRWAGIVKIGGQDIGNIDRYL